MIIQKKIAISLTAAFMLIAAFSVHAATNYYVWRDNLAPQTPFTNWAMAATAIQDAVNLAINGDTIMVTNGTYDTGGAVTPSYALTNRVCINNKSITIQSVNGPDVTIIKGKADPVTGDCGDAAVRCVFINTNASLCGFTLTSGYTKTDGNEYFDRSGGGTFLNSGTISNCVFVGNKSIRYGGGVSFYTGGLMNNCTLNCNTAGYGGGIGAYVGGIANNCILSNNFAGAYGGGVYLEGGTPAINNCLFVANHAATYGGGAQITGTGGNGELNNCLLIGNTVNGVSDGGSAFCSKVGRLNNCTITAGSSGVRCNNGGSVTNCIVWGNTNYDVSMYSVTGTGTVSYTCANQVLTNYGAGNITNNPMFVGPASGNYRLQANSPCVNTGTNFSWMTDPADARSKDLDGHSRIDRFSGIVDMGAYEYLPRGTIFFVP